MEELFVELGVLRARNDLNSWRFAAQTPFGTVAAAATFAKH